MSEISKILPNSYIPIMSDEGILKTYQYYCEKSMKIDPKYSGGISRLIRLDNSKKRQDNLSFDKASIEEFTKKELYKLYGSQFNGDIESEFPLGKGDKLSPDRLKYYMRHDYDFRIYINAPFGEIRYKFILLFAKKCKERGLPCEGKFFHKSAQSSQFDNMILYGLRENINSYLEILEEIKTELPEFAECCGSPIASGLNISYYALTHSGNDFATYNTWFNNLSLRAFQATISELIKEDANFYNNLSNIEKQVVEEFSFSFLQSFNSKNHSILFDKIFRIGSEKEQIFKKILKRYISSNKKIPQQYIIEKLRDKIETICSFMIFGDSKHKDCAFALNKEDYDVIDFNIIKTENKIKKFEYDFTEIKDETKGNGIRFVENLRKGREAIEILKSDDNSIKKKLIELGVNPKETENMSRTTLEERLIYIMGIDGVIGANSLESIRMKRGEFFYNKLQENKHSELNKNIKNLSKNCIDDVNLYLNKPLKFEYDFTEIKDETKGNGIKFVENLRKGREAIEILKSDNNNIKKKLIELGVNPKETENMSRTTLEERLIYIMGIDGVIDKKEPILWANSLASIRGERGKFFYNKFKNNNISEVNKSVKTLSLHCLEDVNTYAQQIKGLANLNEIVQIQLSNI